MSNSMSIERAIEILDPDHREHYDSIETVNTACRMAINALRKQIPQKTVDRKPLDDGYCSVCDCKFNLRSFGSRNNFCGMCGQAIKWED